MPSQLLRIFVAMPGSDMGERAPWSDIDEIKQQLLDPVAELLGEKTGRPTQVFIEKDKPDSGPIHPSMFGEAANAEVYIADLSGANPNVYLELGVRWALRDGVTILISQNIDDDVKFNVSGNRVIPYGGMPTQLRLAISRIVSSAVIGLQDPYPVDSPVRRELGLFTAPRADWEALENEIAELKQAQADDLVAAADKAADDDPAQAIEFLRQAVGRNPVNFQAHFKLGVALRKAADYANAIAELRRVTELKADFAEGWRELGVALNKDHRFPEATEAFRRSVELDDSHAETWANLGGLRRRMARPAAPGEPFDWAMLREARDAYHHASQIRDNDTYSLVNEARVDLLLTAEQPADRPEVLSRLRDLEHLARYEALRKDLDPSERPWKKFDLADTMLLSGRAEESLSELHSAVSLVDPSERRSVLTSAMEPLRDFLAVGVLDEPTADGVRRAIEAYEQAITTA